LRDAIAASALPTPVASSSDSLTNATNTSAERRSRHSVSISNGTIARLLARQPRAPPPLPPPSALSLPQEPIRYPTFTILAILPEENAPLITSALREAQAKWEVSGHTSAFATNRPSTSSGGGYKRSSKVNNNNYQYNPNLMQIIQASDIPLMVYSEPANNDTERLLTSVCEWIAVHNPVMVLSLLDKERNFYASQVAQSTNIPFVSFTQTYRNEINTIGDDHQLEVRRARSESTIGPAHSQID